MIPLLARSQNSWLRIAIGTAAGSALAIPLLYLADWLSNSRDTGLVFELMFFPSGFAVLWIAHKLGWIRFEKRGGVQHAHEAE